MKIEENSRTRLKLVDRSGLLSHVLCLLLSLFFPRLAHAQLEKHVTFDAQKRQLLIERWNLKGKMEDEVIAFSDIAAVEEDEFDSHGPDSYPGGGSWRIAITMRDGSRMNPFNVMGKDTCASASVAARRLLAV
jgi:hypothetical protein